MLLNGKKHENQIAASKPGRSNITVYQQAQVAQVNGLGQRFSTGVDGSVQYAKTSTPRNFMLVKMAWQREIYSKVILHISQNEALKCFA